MHVEERVDGLEFDHDTLTDQKIQPIGILDHEVFVSLLKRQSPGTEFISQRFLIGTFEESRPQFFVNFNRRSTDLFGELIGL